MTKNAIEGKVASINQAGDLVTDISNERASEIENATQARIEIGAHETIGIHSADHDEPTGTLIAIQGPSGFLEIGITGCSISELLGLKTEQHVKITW